MSDKTASAMKWLVLDAREVHRLAGAVRESDVTQYAETIAKYRPGVDVIVYKPVAVYRGTSTVEKKTVGE